MRGSAEPSSANTHLCPEPSASPAPAAHVAALFAPVSASTARTGMPESAALAKARTSCCSRVWAARWIQDAAMLCVTSGLPKRNIYQIEVILNKMFHLRDTTAARGTLTQTR